VAELADDSQLAARGAFVRAEHPERGSFRQLAPLLAGSVREPGPVALRGQDETDTFELLRAAGLGATEIERLQQEGVIA